ncbi:MAG: tRNA uridine-5-carboxymethylaminomethyl(34) synthesis GTPase MnmE [candidate division WOR-3 bacterium]
MRKFSDTICGISTPIGKGAISIIRVSGEDAIKIVSKIFIPKQKLIDVKDRTILHGWIEIPQSGKIIDEVLLFVFKKPFSYTGEDVIEISSHGGLAIPRKIMQLLIENGARIAERGEFTRRSFLNGKMSLLEAEALLDVIEAKTEKSLLLAERNLNGRFRKEIEKIKEEFIEIKTLVETSLDFEETDLISISPIELIKRIKLLKEKLKKIESTYKRGKLLLDGFNLAIVGKPNVGKSSLFNALLQEEKAIVTEIPGTTRDVLEGVLDIEGYTVIIHDMAGIRDADSKVEEIGIKKALEVVNYSDGVLFVLDGSLPLSEEDEEIFNIISNKPFVLVINKKDLKKKIGEIPFPGERIWISAKNHLGIEELNRAIINLIKGKVPDFLEEEIVCTTERQRDKINKAIEALEDALQLLKAGKEIELIAFDIDEAITSLKELTGEITTEEILDSIFSKFCIGK